MVCHLSWIVEIQIWRVIVNNLFPNFFPSSVKKLFLHLLNHLKFCGSIVGVLSYEESKKIIAKILFRLLVELLRILVAILNNYIAVQSPCFRIIKKNLTVDVLRQHKLWDFVHLLITIFSDKIICLLWSLEWYPVTSMNDCKEFIWMNFSYTVSEEIPQASH